MNALPPVLISEDEVASNTSMQIPVLEDPEQVIDTGSSNNKKRRNAIFIGAALAVVAGSWLALNMPLQKTVPDNMQVESDSMNNKNSVAGNGS